MDFYIFGSLGPPPSGGTIQCPDDVARLAVDAILRVDHETWIGLFRRVGIDRFMDGGGASELRWLAISGQVFGDRNRRVLEVQKAGAGSYKFPKPSP